jgi:hypothetical protein
MHNASPMFDHRKSFFLWSVVLCAVLVMAAEVVVAGWRVPNGFAGLYGNSDGLWASWNLRAVLEWGEFLDPSPFSLLIGAGSSLLPNLPWLNPGALTFVLPVPLDLKYVASYLVYFAELVSTIYVLMRAIGLSPLRSLVASQIYILVLFPPTHGFFLSLFWYSLAPVNAHLVAMANVILALFLHSGRRGNRSNLLAMAGIVLCSLSLMFSAPVTFLTYVPAYGSAAIALLLPQRPTRTELGWKLASIAVVGVLFLAMGLPEYLKATAAVSARADIYSPAFHDGAAILTWGYWKPLLARFDVCSEPQTLLCGHYKVFWFQVIALVGAAYELILGPRKLRGLAIWFLAFIAFVHFYRVATEVSLFGSAHVISTSYLYWSSYVFFCLFISDFTIGSIARLSDVVLGSGRAWHRLMVVSLMVVPFVVPALDWYLYVRRIAPNISPVISPLKHKIGVLPRSAMREAVVGPITAYLKEHAAITPGMLFRGYTVTYFGDSAGPLRSATGYEGPHNGTDMYVRARDYMDIHYGNRLQEVDLWQFNIPTIEEYGQWVTRQSMAFARRMFANPGDNFYPWSVNVYKLDWDLLKLAGVRFVITDLLIQAPGVTLRAQQTSPTGVGPINLYEIANPNLGTYSPVHAEVAAGFDDALSRVIANRETLTRSVVTFEPLSGLYIPLESSEVTAVKDGVIVTATSSGRSLLLLPVQYSRCWQASAMGDQSPVRLLRANGIQTLIEFDRHLAVRLKFRFGFFGAAHCRLDDADDLSQLGLH